MKEKNSFTASSLSRGPGGFTRRLRTSSIAEMASLRSSESIVESGTE